jgi:hypothetical protein
MAAVNEHLRVQLDALREELADTGTDPVLATRPPAPSAPLRPPTRRAQVAVDWVDALVADAADRRTTDPVVVSRADRSVYVVEGTVRRRVGASLVTVALEALYGERRPITDADFHELTEGPPVEILEGPTGGPFVVAGGRRLAVRGLSLPHPVDQGVLDALPEGPPIDLGRASSPRRSKVAADWVASLTVARDDDPAPGGHLATTPDGAVVVVEGRLRRAVPAGLLVPALESVLGEAHPSSNEELDELEEGAPVEVLEGRSGLPFVVVGGRRLPVAGLPLPFPVERSPLDGLPEGPTLDTPAALQPRRAHAVAAWLGPLVDAATDEPPAIVTDEGKAYVREGAVFRRINAGLLTPALERRLGPRRPVTDEERAAWVEGPPVEVIEGLTGPPFVVVGGVRVPVRNLPVPHPVRASALDGLPEGPAIDVTAAHKETEQALKAARAELEAERPGVVRETAHLIRKKLST